MSWATDTFVAIFCLNRLKKTCQWKSRKWHFEKEFPQSDMCHCSNVPLVRKIIAHFPFKNTEPRVVWVRVFVWVSSDFQTAKSRKNCFLRWQRFDAKVTSRKFPKQFWVSQHDGGINKACLYLMDFLPSGQVTSRLPIAVKSHLNGCKRRAMTLLLQEFRVLDSHHFFSRLTFWTWFVW